MKTGIRYIIFFLTLTVFSFGQKGRDKVETLRIAYITEHVGLTPPEAEKFWPVYNEYHEKLRGVKKDLKKAVNRYSETLKDEEIERICDAEEASRKAELEIHQTYSAKLRQLLGARKYLRLRIAEEDFKREMIKTIRGRHE